MPFQESPALTRASKSVKMRTLHQTSIWIRKTGKPVFLGNRFCLWPTVYILVTIRTQWVPMDSSLSLRTEWFEPGVPLLSCLFLVPPGPHSHLRNISQEAFPGPATLSTPTHKHSPPELMGTCFLKWHLSLSLGSDWFVALRFLQHPAQIRLHVYVAPR